jgi:peptidoglycan-associated lipoprotein
MSPLKDPNNILSERSIYFDFDKFEIRPEFGPRIMAHSKYLVAHPQETVTLEGHADDRGSREYNLALGQKRAVAVKALMNYYGVPNRQIETISFGEEKPRTLGHHEAAWADNRRTDITHSSD